MYVVQLSWCLQKILFCLVFFMKMTIIYMSGETHLVGFFGYITGPVPVIPNVLLLHNKQSQTSLRLTELNNLFISQILNSPTYPQWLATVLTPALAAPAPPAAARPPLLAARSKGRFIQTTRRHL